MMRSIKKRIQILYVLITLGFAFLMFGGIDLYISSRANDIQKLQTVLTAELIGLAVLFVLFGFCMYCKDVERRVERERISMDDLTGLPIKQKHKIEAEELLARNKCRYAYITFDVNNFKYINDMFGYEYGNEVLKHIGNLMKRMMRTNEAGTRSAGDDFSMLLVYDGQESFEERLHYFFEEAEKMPEIAEHPKCMVAFTCGVYLIEGDETINKIRSYANIARKSIEKSFETIIRYYDEAFHSKLLMEKEMEYDMYHALDNQEFVVYLQPKYDINTACVIGAEALVRWKHGSKGMLTPNSFVRLFEENGFIKVIDFYVLEVVCKCFRKWLDMGLEPVKVSVNLSRLHIRDADLTQQLSSITRKYRVPNHYIEFELTETAVLEEMDALLKTMQDLKDAGFSIAMDDFGTGYSSLNLLRKIPVDVLKLDKEFFDACSGETEGRDKQIILHIIAMAKDLKIAVLAEGVETQEQLDFLKESNCDMIQGYYYAKPMPINEFETLNFEATGLK